MLEWIRNGARGAGMNMRGVKIARSIDCPSFQDCADAKVRIEKWHAGMRKL